MKLSVWVQFTWNLKSLTAETPKIDKRYTVEAATPDDRQLLLAAVSRSMSMEPAWSDDLGPAREVRRRKLSKAPCRPAR